MKTILFTIAFICSFNTSASTQLQKTDTEKVCVQITNFVKAVYEARHKHVNIDDILVKIDQQGDDQTTRLLHLLAQNIYSQPFINDADQLQQEKLEYANKIYKICITDD